MSNLASSGSINTLEYPLFKDYTIAVKQFLETVCYLSRLPDNANVAVFPLQPEKAFTKFIIPVINGSNLNPTITFSISPQIQYLDNENNLGFVKQRVIKDSTVKYIKPELLFELIYNVQIFTKTKVQADILIYQILNAANKNRKYSMKTQGQFVEIEATQPRDETDLMPGEAQDILFKHALDLRIPRAYLPRDYEEYDIGGGVAVDISADEIANVPVHDSSIYDLAMRDK